MDADGIAESEERLVERHIETEIISTHEAGTFAGSQQADGEAALSGDKENLPPAAAARGTEASGNAVGAQLSH